MAEIDSERQQHIDYAVSQGSKTAETIEAELIEKKEWSEDKNRAIRDARAFLDGLIRTKSKLHLPSQVEQIKTQIDKAQKDLIKLETEKREIIGYTAEHYADKKITQYYILHSFFTENTLTKCAFDDFESVEDVQFTEYVNDYNRIIEHFSNENIKWVALNPIFLNSFYLCKDNPFTYFGKSVIQLTSYQIELFSYGRYFKSIFSEIPHENIPDDVREDPNSLIEWYDTSKNAKTIMDKQKNKSGGATSLVGATAEDRKKLGIEGNVIDFNEKLKKSGGAMSFDDILKAHGEI